MLLAYAGAALALLRRDFVHPDHRAAALVLGVVLAYVVLVHVVAAPFPRYSVPFRVLQYVLAAGVIVRVSAFARARAGQARSAP
jgi:hypothetical protein